MEFKLRPLGDDDFVKVKAIYDWYIANSTATFHTEPISIAELKTFIYVDDSIFQSFMIEQDSQDIGYCYLTRYKNRQAYDRTAEVTLYLINNIVGQGIGSKVLSQIESIAKNNGLKNLLAIVTGENLGSIVLFERAGYEKCAHFKRVGEKFGRVLDVLGFQKEL